MQNPLNMTKFTIELPDSLALELGDTPEGRSLRVKECLALLEYRLGHLSHRQVGEMLGLDYWQTESFFAEHKVPLNYSLNDLEADRATLDKILGSK